jgi:arylsulfatase A-like enzyme
VFTVSGKDRAAIMLGGRRPTLAVWLDPLAGFTTSRYYARALPGWLARFDADRGLAPFAAAKLPERWSHRTDDPRALRDDDPSESPQWSRTSPHPVRASTQRETIDALRRTPYLDQLTLDLARTIVDAERLAEGPDTSLLAVSLSATDHIGHAYGPDSQEALAALEELDRQLGDFLAFLEARVPKASLLVVLTADHGVSSTPEVAAELGASECRASPTGRVRGADFQRHVAEAVRAACDVDVGPVAWDSNYAFKLDPAVWPRIAQRCGKTRPQVLAEVRAALRARPGVVEVWTAAELSGPEACSGYCALQRASFAGERSGDLVVQLDPTCQLTAEEHGAGHGSPYASDRAVPLVFWGNDVAPGVVRGRARTVDVGPTLAHRLGLTPDPAWDGSALPLE